MQFPDHLREQAEIQKGVGDLIATFRTLSAPHEDFTKLSIALGTSFLAFTTSIAAYGKQSVVSPCYRWVVPVCWLLILASCACGLRQLWLFAKFTKYIRIMTYSQLGDDLRSVDAAKITRFMESSPEKWIVAQISTLSLGVLGFTLWSIAVLLGAP